MKSLPVATPVQTSLVIHVREVYNFSDDNAETFLRDLSRAIEKSDVAIILILTTIQAFRARQFFRLTEEQCDSLACAECGDEKEVIHRAPVLSRAQRALLDSHQKLEESYELGNISLP